MVDAHHDELISWPSVASVRWWLRGLFSFEVVVSCLLRVVKIYLMKIMGTHEGCRPALVALHGRAFVFISLKACFTNNRQPASGLATPVVHFRQWLAIVVLVYTAMPVLWQAWLWCLAPCQSAFRLSQCSAAYCGMHSVIHLLTLFGALLCAGLHCAGHCAVLHSHKTAFSATHDTRPCTACHARMIFDLYNNSSFLILAKVF